MDAAERLAALLADELAADERAALEAELARDPALRAQLLAMQRADAALGGLTSPELPAGADERLRAALAPVLAEQLGTTPAGAGSGATTLGTAPSATPAVDADAAAGRDEVAARRTARRRRSGWAPGLVGVAAALAVAVAVATGDLTGGGDDATTAAGDAELTEMADDMDAGGDVMALEAAPATEGPVLLAEDRAYTEDDLDGLVAAVELDAVRERDLDGAAGAAMAADWQSALGADAGGLGGLATEEQDTVTDGAATEESDDGGAPDGGMAGDTATGGVTAERRTTTPLEPEDELAVGRCLAEVLDDLEAAIPVTAELATLDGEAVVIYRLVTIDPATGRFTRGELWVVDRGDCQVRHVAQQ